MRVFDKYTFNIISKVEFKDTKKYIDAMLNELGLSYRNVSFSYEGYKTKIESVIEKYPNLSKYCYEYVLFKRNVLTSFKPNWRNGEIYAEQEDWNSLFEIVSKCPREMNIFPTLVLDQIDWYGEGVKETALKALEGTEGEAEIYYPWIAINSQIILLGKYNYENRRNVVQVIVEATVEGQSEPRNTTDIIKKLETYLGTPVSSERICRYSMEEEENYREKKKECERLLYERIENFYPRKRDVKFDKVEFIPNLADKKKIKDAFKGTGFEMGDRKRLIPGMNRVLCKDSHNHQYEILFDRTQNSPDYFYWYVKIEGHNFLINSGQNTMYASSENEAREKLSMIAKFCTDFVAEFDKTLVDNFGATPEWYFYKGE
ncbi:MAG: hypothetical protein ACI4F0_05280 [Agathobacter sp.]